MANIQFQSTTPATPAATVKVATDTIAGVDVQLNKLVDGTVGSTLPIPGDSTLGLFVQVKATTLPPGAAIASKQAALGTAGTASSDVLSVQGIASGTPLGTADANLDIAQGSTTSGQKGPLMQGAVTTSSPSYTNAQTSPVSLDTSGSLRVSVVSGSTGNAAAGNTGSAVPAQADYIGVNVGGTQQGAIGVDMDSGAGTQYGLAVNLRQIASGGSVEAGIVANPLFVAPKGFLDSGSADMTDMSLHALKVSLVGDTVGSVVATDNGTVNGGTANTACAITEPYKFNGTNWIRGGGTPYKLNSGVSTNATSVKASAGTLAMCAATNINTALRYLKFYNKASAPTVGTDTPVFVFALPPAAAAGQAGGICVPIPPEGINFSTGIAFAITSGAADSDTGAVSLNDVIVNLSTF